jgi:hypothetical protein
LHFRIRRFLPFPGLVGLAEREPNGIAVGVEQAGQQFV